MTKWTFCMQYIDIENCQIWSATGQDDDAIVGQKLNNSAVNNVCSSGHKMLKSIFGKYLFILQANLRSTPFKENISDFSPLCDDGPLS